MALQIPLTLLMPQCSQGNYSNVISLRRRADYCPDFDVWRGAYAAHRCDARPLDLIKASGELLLQNMVHGLTLVTRQDRQSAQLGVLTFTNPSNKPNVNPSLNSSLSTQA